MSGKVVDKATYLIGREGVRVGLGLYTPRKQLQRSAITDMDGKFIFTQLDDKEYIVKVDHEPEKDYVEIVLADDQNEPYAISTSEDQDVEGYFRFRKLPKDFNPMETIDLIDESGFQHHYYTMLAEEEPGVPYELHYIEFRTGSHHLPTAQNDELDQLARELQESPQIIIQIDGHTDNVGSDRHNVKLSLKRAEAVKDYLVSQGVAEDRIACKGYGSMHPIASNENERGRNMNRRVEFSIVP